MEIKPQGTIADEKAATINSRPVPEASPQLPTTNYKLPTSTWLWPVLLFCVIGLLVYSVRVAAVTGRSMEPALREGSRIIIDKLTVRLLSVNRGDVIVFKNPKDAAVTEVKRVIGLPSELVLIEGGTISVTPPGGRIIEFPRGTSVGGNGQIGDFRVQLGPQEYFVLGDNRNMSTDSRSFGAVRPADIVGRVIFSF